MNPNDGAGRGSRPGGAPERFFTVESANDALVFVRMVVKDSVGAYEELMNLRAARQELSLEPDAGGELEELGVRIERNIERLKELHRELLDVGCDLKDLSTGLVDFPARYEGRTVLLCWKLGEPEVAHWHELRAGFAGRRPIDVQFRLGVGEALAVEAEPIGPG